MLAPTVTRRLISSFVERARRRAGRPGIGSPGSPAGNGRRPRGGRGLSNAEIGRELAMSEATVKAHVSRALAKLGLSNRVQAAILVHDATG